MKERWIVTALCLFVLMGGKSFAEEGSATLTADLTVTTYLDVYAEWADGSTHITNIIPAGAFWEEVISVSGLHNMGDAQTFNLTVNVT